MRRLKRLFALQTDSSLRKFLSEDFFVLLSFFGHFLPIFGGEKKTEKNKKFAVPFSLPVY
jgi:hypothetical protein